MNVIIFLIAIFMKRIFFPNSFCWRKGSVKSEFCRNFAAMAVFILALPDGWNGADVI
jgi:hypothetical protein